MEKQGHVRARCTQMERWSSSRLCQGAWEELGTSLCMVESLLASAQGWRTRLKILLKLGQSILCCPCCVCSGHSLLTPSILLLIPY